MADLAIYFEGKRMYPQVGEVLASILPDYPQFAEVEEWSETTDRTVPVLVLGVLPEVLPITYVKTLSQKQILANPAAITELRAAFDLLSKPYNWPEVPYAVVDALTDAEERRLGQLLVVDIETGGTVQSDLPEDWWLLSLAIYDGDKCYVFTEESLAADTLDNARPQLLRILKSGRKLVAHNSKFDFRSLSEFLGEKVYAHGDTMLLHHAINPGGKEHDLKNTARKYVGAPDWDADIKKHLKDRKVGYEQIPRELLYHYNAGDVIWTWRLLHYLLKAAEGDKRIADLAKREYAMGNFYQDVENRGATVDLKQLDYLREKYTAELIPLTEALRDSAWEDFNPNSPQQVKKWFADRGITMKSTDEKHLEDLARTDVSPRVRDFMDNLLEWRGIAKLNNTYVKGITERLHFGNRVFPTLKVHGTNTGRLSSSNPNIQNIPRDKELRKLFISQDEETRVVLNVDYSQAELRVMAVLSGDPYLTSLFQPDAGDFFDNLMPNAFPKADISAWTPSEAKENRAKLKGVIYGMSYGRKAAAIAKALEMPEWEAQAIINNYFNAAPVLYDWREWVKQMAVDPEETLISPYGRYYQNEVVTGRNKINVENSGLAFLPQSTASDLCVDAAMEVHKWAPKYDAWIWATVHDAIMLDVPKVHAEEVGARVQYEMEQAGIRKFGTVVPFAAEAGWARSWGEAD